MMIKTILGFFLGLVIGVGCHYFDIPLPGPHKFIGALVILSVTFGYVGMDYLLTRPAKKARNTVRLEANVIEFPWRP